MIDLTKSQITIMKQFLRVWEKMQTNRDKPDPYITKQIATLKKQIKDLQ